MDRKYREANFKCEQNAECSIEPTKGREMVVSTGWVTTWQCDLGEREVAVGH